MTQVIRWNTGFIKGLAQSVLDRAKAIRGSLAGNGEEAATEPKAKRTKPPKKIDPTSMSRRRKKKPRSAKTQKRSAKKRNG